MSIPNHIQLKSEQRVGVEPTSHDISPCYHFITSAQVNYNMLLKELLIN